MNEIDWASKLTSRKFWMAICGLISGLMMAFRADENTVNNVTGVVMAAASVIAYCIGEGLADAAGVANGDTIATSGYVTWEPEEKPPENDPTEDDLR